MRHPAFQEFHARTIFRKTEKRSKEGDQKTAQRASAMHQQSSQELRSLTCWHEFLVQVCTNHLEPTRSKLHVHGLCLTWVYLMARPTPPPGKTFVAQNMRRSKFKLQTASAHASALFAGFDAQGDKVHVFMQSWRGQFPNSNNCYTGVYDYLPHKSGSGSNHGTEIATETTSCLFKVAPRTGQHVSFP